MERTTNFVWKATIHPEHKDKPFDPSNQTLVEQVERRILHWIAEGHVGGVIIFERFSVEWSVA